MNDRRRLSYLGGLISRLGRGAAALPESQRRRHAGFLRARQQPDGGFPGRRGGSDPYYTSFALRGLAVLGALDEPTAERAAGYAASALANVDDLIGLHAVVSCAAMIGSVLPESSLEGLGNERLARKTAEVLLPLRRDDGGYARSPRGGPSSTYHTFLAATLLDGLGRPAEPARRATMVRMIAERQRGDGGFAELPPMSRGGTNPTAAAVGALSILDAVDAIDTEGATDFLAGMQAPDGGVRAHARIGLGDLLSGFTALVTLEQLDRGDRLDRAGLRCFAGNLAGPDGGFAAGYFDPARDCEYTFYGLGCLALCEEPAS